MSKKKNTWRLYDFHSFISLSLSIPFCAVAFCLFILAFRWSSCSILFMFYNIFEQIVTRCELRAALRPFLSSDTMFSSHECWCERLHRHNTKNKFVLTIRMSYLSDSDSVCILYVPTASNCPLSLSRLISRKQFVCDVWALVSLVIETITLRTFKWNAACLGNDSCEQLLSPSISSSIFDRTQHRADGVECHRYLSDRIRM